MTDNHRRQPSASVITKKRQSLLQTCAELSSKCGARILVIYTYQQQHQRISLTFLFPQCIITMPDDPSVPSHAVEFNALGCTLPVADGNTVVFDSVSPAHVVQARNSKDEIMINSSSKHRRFYSDFTVNVRGSISAFLTADTAKSFCGQKMAESSTSTSLCVPSDVKENAPSRGDHGRYRCDEGIDFFSLPPQPPSFFISPFGPLGYLSAAAANASYNPRQREQQHRDTFNSSSIIGDDEMAFKPRAISSDGIVVMQPASSSLSGKNSSSELVAATVSVSHIMNMRDLPSPHQSSSDLVLSNAMEMDAVHTLQQLITPPRAL